MADVGYIALLIALLVSLYSAIGFVVGVKKNHQAMIASASNGLIAVCVLITVSVAILIYALIAHDFHFEYVASYSSRDTSLPYLISALWAGNSGSLLFWAWLLSLFAAVVVLKGQDKNAMVLAYASLIMMVSEAFFLFLLLVIANPFSQIFPAPLDGVGLNPILENPGMIFHPPLLLAGYVSVTVPFAYAMAALLAGKLGDGWIIAVRRWMLLAWLLLGVGNIIGAWWAYVELGWGGYWAWDPVENAGLMPWLIATAFLHSTIMQRRKGIFKVWNMVLVITAFCLVMFGTFLTRSGILSSVHSFGESGMGSFFSVFISVILFVALALIYYRYETLKGKVEVKSLVSKESTFLLGNVLLVGSAVAILIGTIFPAISEALAGVKISVGASFFNTVNGPIFMAIVILIGLCTLIGWRRVLVKNLLRKFFWLLVTALVVTIALFISGVREWYTLVASFICGFAFLSVLLEWLRELRSRHQVKPENYFKIFWGLLWSNKPRYGGYIVHIAIIIIAIGIIGSSFYSIEKESSLKPGGSMSINNYTLTYEGVEQTETQNKLVFRATVSVYDQGKLIGQLFPEKYINQNYEQPVTEVAIRSTIFEDIYVIPSGWDDGGAAAFKVLINPMVSWIWVGGGVFLLGGLIAFWSNRRKLSAPGKQGQDGEE